MTANLPPRRGARRARPAPARLVGPLVGLAALAPALAWAGKAPPAPPPTPPPAVTTEANATWAHEGWSVAGVGDVNGDGRYDVLVGLPTYSNGQEREGAAQLYLGTGTGLATTPAWTYEGNQAGAGLGTAVASAGDVNNDGKADVIVGAPLYDNGEVDEGRAYVFLGATGGLQASPSWTAESNQAGALFGGTVASSTPKGFTSEAATRKLTGSFNGDSFSDVVVGAPFFDDGQVDEGKVFVYNGSAAGPSASPSWTAQLDQAGARFGQSLGTAGKSNNDAYLDLAVGAMYWTATGVTNCGRVVIYRGSATGLAATPAWSRLGDSAQQFFGGTVAAAGDVNNDGYWDLLVAAWANLPAGGTTDTPRGKAFLFLGASGGTATTPQWNITSTQDGDQLGQGLASAGYFDADAYADVVVAAPYYTATGGAAKAGRTIVYKGGSTGLTNTALLTADAALADANVGFVASPAGDVNGDGKWDVVLGAPDSSNGHLQEGSFVVQFGR